MKKYMLKGPMRFFILVAAAFVWTGILLTGLRTVHWFLFIPASFFALAALTGICPGIIVSNLLFGRNPDGTDKS
jgi:hypothetical protein